MLQLQINQIVRLKCGYIANIYDKRGKNFSVRILTGQPNLTYSYSPDGKIINNNIEEHRKEQYEIIEILPGHLPKKPPVAIIIETSPGTQEMQLFSSRTNELIAKFPLDKSYH